MKRFQNGTKRRGQLQEHPSLVDDDNDDQSVTQKFPNDDVVTPIQQSHVPIRSTATRLLPQIPPACRSPWTHGVSSSSFDDDNDDDTNSEQFASLVEEKKSQEWNETHEERPQIMRSQSTAKHALPPIPPKHKSPWTNGVSVSFRDDSSNNDGYWNESNEMSGLSGTTGPRRARCFSYQSFHQEQHGGNHHRRHRRKDSLGEDILGAVGHALQPIRQFGQNVFGKKDPHPRVPQHNHHHERRVAPPKKSNNPRVARAWRILREKVQSGEVLLERPSMQQRGGLKHQSTKSQRWRQREEFQESIRSGLEFNLYHCLAVMAVYMLISVVAFSFLFEHWSLVDSMYFALVTCTTIGYGDLVPQTAAGRLFTCVYGLTGVCCLGIALGILGSHIVATEEKAVEQTSDVAKKRLLSLFSASKSSEMAELAGEDEKHRSLEEKTKERELFLDEAIPDAKPNPLRKLFVHFSLVMVMLAIFALIILHDPGLGLSDFDFFDAFYFSIVTATTVGYGDFAPTSQQGRLFTIFFIPLAVGAMGHFLSSVAEEIMKSRSDAVRERLAAQELCQTDLEIMDADGDGLVTRAEFLEFMLVSLNKVDKDFIEELRHHFDKLDVDGTGVLSKDDLVYQARKKLQRIHRKLELSSYKQELLRKAAAARQNQRPRMLGLDWDRRVGLGGSLINVFANIVDDTADSSDDSNDESSTVGQCGQQSSSGNLATDAAGGQDETLIVAQPREDQCLLYSGANHDFPRD